MRTADQYLVSQKTPYYFYNSELFYFKTHRNVTLTRRSKSQSSLLSLSLTATAGGPRPRPTKARMDLAKEKLVVIMGATGTGKSRLSLDLASHFPLEIVNSDKMQVYKGLDVTTNKLPVQDRFGVPHHLLGEVDSGELTRSEFRFLAGRAVSEIASRRKLPVLVGGSNSFVHALLVDRFDPDYDAFDHRSAAAAEELRYECCFLWVHVSSRVLRAYLDKRVDEMLDSGMFAELAEFYDPGEDHGPASRTGIRKAIGVPEFDRFFERFGPGGADVESRGNKGWDRVRRRAYDEAVWAIKENTWQLARRQVGKILRLKNAMGWDLRKVDATEAFTAAMMTSDSGKRRCTEAWERQVLEPSVKIVKRFLDV